MKSLYRSYQIEIIIFITLVISLFTYTTTIDSYSYAAYLMNYSTGFGGRKLIGTIADAIIPSSLNYKTGVYIFAGLFCIILSAIVSMLFGRLLKNVSNNNTVYYATIYLAVIYLVSPASVALFFPFHNFARLDMYILILTLLMVTILCSKGYLYKSRYIWILLLSIVCCLIHQMFIFTYFTIIVSLLIYDSYRHNFSRKTIIPILVVSSIIGSLSLYLQFSQRIDVSYDNIMALIAHKVPADELHKFEKPIRFEYFANIQMHINEYISPWIKVMIIRMVIAIVLLLPLIVIFVKIWRSIIKKCVNKNQKILFNLMQIAILGILPLFVFTCDHGRWLASYFIGQFLFLFVTIYLKDPIVIATMEELWNKIKSKPAVYAMLGVYLTAMGYFQAFNVMEPANSIYDLILITISYVR